MYASVVPSKTIPVFRPKRPKNPTLLAVHTYMAYMREYPWVLTPFMIVRDRDQV